MALSRELSELDAVVEAIRAYRAAAGQPAGLEALLDDPATDAEMRALAEDELPAGPRRRWRQAAQDLRLLLLPKDEADEKSAILEIRAGTGGDEAALFAGDLFRMYARYAELKGWKVEIMSESEGTAGGYKEVVAEIKGRGVFARLKFESGVHRVQRVPDTETQGRIHTSAATVAVLPEAEDVDIAINDADLKIDTMRAQGAGGQHVNKTESAIRITHIPTGIGGVRPGRALAAQEPRPGHGPPARPPLRRRAHRQGRRPRRRPARRRSAPATAPSASAPTISRKAA